jgi:hypothetical protein
MPRKNTALRRQCQDAVIAMTTQWLKISLVFSSRNVSIARKSKIFPWQNL